VANEFQDVKDRLADVFTGYEPPPMAGSSAPAEPGWPVEQADVLVVDLSQAVALCTLGDLELARTVAGHGHPRLAAVGPMATENIGVEKLVRNVVANPAIGAVVLVGPETGGSAPTGHYAGDALLCLVEHGIDPGSHRIMQAKGRRPILKNLTPGEIELFRARVEVIDHRGLADPSGVAAAIEHAADHVRDHVSSPVPMPAAGSLRDAVSIPYVEAAPAGSGYRKDPAGYFVIFCDHVSARLVVEHYTNDDERTAVVVGSDPRAVGRTVLERRLLSTMDHAVYLGGELERAAAALRAGRAYVQDENANRPD